MYGAVFISIRALRNGKPIEAVLVFYFFPLQFNRFCRQFDFISYFVRRLGLLKADE